MATAAGPWRGEVAVGWSLARQHVNLVATGAGRGRGYAAIGGCRNGDFIDAVVVAATVTGNGSRCFATRPADRGGVSASVSV